jgi:hypothetical protein
MFGSHLSIAGGIHKELLEAERLGMTTTQLFTNNFRGVESKRIRNNAADFWRALSSFVSSFAFFASLRSHFRSPGVESRSEFFNQLASVSRKAAA